MSKLGVYWSVMHRRPQDYEYFKRLQPSVFKIMDGGPPDYAWARENLPNSLIIARDHALSEQHSDMLKDPVGTGKRHAQEWDRHQVRLGFDRAKTLILGINEAHVWEPGVPEALRLYTISLCDEATNFDLRVGAMQLSVGWPGNTGPDTPPNWEPFHGVDNAIRANHGALVAHEYFADNGPGEMWGWWCGRALKCPWQVPIIIGETGVDMFVKDGSVERHKRGWRGNLEPERYARELADYTARMSADSRFVGNCVFAADFASQDWFSFDIEPAYQAILATPIPALPTKPIDTHLPQIGSGNEVYSYVDAPAGANLRIKPEDGKVLAAIPYGQRVQILAANGDVTWYQVRWNDKTGWIFGELLNKNAPQPKPEPTLPPPPQPMPATGIIDPITALAFLQVESGNVPFTNGLLTIRFEVHRFKANLKNDELFNRHFKFTPGNYGEQYWRPSPDGEWIHAHGSMADRHKLLNFARGLNDTAALRSIGMGMAQVMGENHARIGYKTPQAMFKAFSHPRFGVNAQVFGFVNYVLSDPALFAALRQRDWMKAIQKYNGTGQEAFYLRQLEDALNRIESEIAL